MFAPKLPAKDPLQPALGRADANYEIVKHKWLGKRERVVELTGHEKLPFIELEDGTILREESKELAERMRRGELQVELPEPLDGTQRGYTSSLAGL